MISDIPRTQINKQLWRVS